MYFSGCIFYMSSLTYKADTKPRTSHEKRKLSSRVHFPLDEHLVLSKEIFFFFFFFSHRRKQFFYPKLGEADPGGLGACPQESARFNSTLLYLFL
jgi:hypothetical protein